MQAYIEIEIYDEGADGQEDSGCWPTKFIHIPKAWLNEYAKSATRYKSADDLIANYSFDELDGMEELAQKDGIIL